jgi:hypothetical protein
MRPSKFFLSQDVFWWLQNGASKKSCDMSVLSDSKSSIPKVVDSVWTVLGKKWMLRSSKTLFPATIPILVDENQTVDEFWKWEESRPPF